MAENNQPRENQDNNSGMSPRESTGNTSKRGFASMDPQQQREIASKGGQAAHQQGVAHEWNSEEARRAGRKGGQASRNNSRRNTQDNSENRDQAMDIDDEIA
jgi:general stress protein YciG